MSEAQGSANQHYQPTNALQVSTTEQFQGDSPQVATSFVERTRLKVFRLIGYIRAAKRTTLIGIALALVLLIGLGYTFIPRNFNGTIQVQQYYFQVYCPINDQIAQKNFEEFIDRLNLTHTSEAQLKRLKQFVNGDSGNNIDKYIVWVKAAKPNPNANYTQLYYCGYTRDWNSTDCSKPKAICSIPGPLFYVERNQVIDVAWVYNIDKDMAKQLQVVQYGTSFPYCYNMTKNGTTDEHCMIKAKKQGRPQCTYPDPTQVDKTTTDDMVVSYTQIPVGAHIHGLQVRPTFDGNPLSWINSMDQNQTKLGVGFQSLGNQKYYSFFNRFIPTEFVITPDQASYIKINRYDNVQAPGNLWYHDHGMHATFANVAMGLAGGYIIHDKAIDSALPKGENEINIIIAAGYPYQADHDEDKTHMKVNPPSAFFNSTSPPVFNRNQTYRIRMLNGEFDAIFTDLRFVADCQKDIVGNLRNCKYVLSLSVIGADSTLFDKPINNVNSFTLASAERIEFLLVINGGGINQLPSNIKHLFLISDNVTNTIRKTFTIADYVQNTMDPAIPSSIGVPFYNLSQISPLPCTPQLLKQPSQSFNCINARRMRPLLRDTAFKFFINGHYKFSESGASENPTIGTTEDWYFMNTMLNPAIHHPMHVHLISFQVLQKGKLKYFTTPNNINCTYYEVDYYIQAGFNFTNTTGDINDKCRQLRSNFDVTKDSILKNKFLENQPNTTSSYNLYGVDLEDKLPDGSTNYVGTNCQNSTKYKYICDEFLDIPVWYQHWKEVVTVMSGEYMKIRIRWTSADYNGIYPYFKVPEDQLIEFPGYVYHCHFLQHQDDELMRPIMMQPSEYFKNHTFIENPDLRKCMINQPEGWTSRAKCINQLIGCS